MIVTLRPVTSADKAFVERVYFDTQRWITERLFGWRGDEVEAAKFAESYDESRAKIVVVDGVDSGWLEVRQSDRRIELKSIYLVAEKQRLGVGTTLIKALIEEASALNASLVLSTAKINPARNLYERLGFVVVRQDEYKVYMQHGLE